MKELIVIRQFKIDSIWEYFKNSSQLTFSQKGEKYVQSKL